MGFESGKIKVQKLDWLSYMAAAMLVFWSNIIFFDAINNFAGKLLVMLAYIITFFVIVQGSKRISTPHIYLIGIAIIVFVASLFLKSNLEYLLSYWFNFLFAGSMSVLMSSIITKPKYILSWWLLFSLPISIISFYFYRSGGGLLIYMTTSYYIINLFIWLMLYTIERPRWYYYIPLGISFLALIIIGTRGAIVTAILATIATFLFMGDQLKWYNKLYKYVIIIFSSVLTYILLFKEAGLEFLLNLSDSFSLQSRMTKLLMSEKLESRSDRFIIYEDLIDEFSKGNFFGYGLGGDAVILKGNYAHNFILELLADFGVLAIPLFISFIYLIRKSVLITKNMEWQKVGLLFLFVAFLPKLFSMTLLHPLTLSAIGVLMQVKRFSVKQKG